MKIQKAVCTNEDDIWGPRTYRGLIDFGILVGPVNDGNVVDPIKMTLLNRIKDPEKKKRMMEFAKMKPDFEGILERPCQR